MNRRLIRPLAVTSLLGAVALFGCKSAVTRVEAANEPAPETVVLNDKNVVVDAPAPSSKAPAPRLERVAAVDTKLIPTGTRVRVRTLETLDTKRNRAGDRFTATLDEPIVSGDRVVIPRGTVFNGHITQAKPSGRFAGHAVLALTLDSFTHGGRVYSVRSTAPARATTGGHKKRNWLAIGGGSGAGAAIGAAAGGGAGALIGAGAGAAAGTAGALITGRKNVTIPVESTLTFTLQSPVNIRG